MHLTMVPRPSPSARPRRRVVPRRLGAGLVATAVLAAAACSGSDDAAPADTSPAATERQVGELPAAMVEIMDEEPYSHARWGVEVAPLSGGDAVVSRRSEELFGQGSTTKLFSVGTYLDTVGLDDRIETPVFQQGDDLVLQAMGDPVMGGRESGAEQLGYGVPPQPSAGVLPGVTFAPGDPLAGLDSLAAQVAAAGVTEVLGDVIIDDRLFEPWDTIGGPITPIVINDNLVAVEASPTEEGQPAEVRVVPETEAFTVDNQTTTAAAGEGTGVSLGPADPDDANGPGSTRLVLSGEIAADDEPFLNVFNVPDPPAFARTLFIEALERAGVSVAADPVGENDVSGLGPFGSRGADPVATITSPTSQQAAALIWKISFNLGANLVTCLVAVEGGSTDCRDGLTAIHDRLDALDITNNEVWPLNGAGSDFSSATPSAMVTWLRWMRERPWGEQVPDMLPILGVDGSLSLSQTDTPSTGHVQAKTGTWAGIDEGTATLLMAGQGLAGFLQADDGEEYAFALSMNGGTFPGSPGQGLLDANDDLAEISAALQRAVSDS